MAKRARRPAKADPWLEVTVVDLVPPRTYAIAALAAAGEAQCAESTGCGFTMLGLNWSQCYALP